MNQLPPGWTQATIADLVGPAGLFTDGDWVESKDQDPNGHVRLTQLADVGDGTWRNRSRRFMTATKAKELDCTFLDPGDVLIARMPDPLGRACIFPGDSKPCVTAVDVCVIRPAEGVHPRWLMHFVNAHPFRHQVEALQKGTTRKRISRRNLATIRLPVPPPAEQGRIVAAIEKLFSHLDAGIESLQRTRRNLRRLRRAVLMSVVPEPLPRHWSVVPVGQAGRVDLGRQRAPKYHRGPNMRPYLRVANVFEDRIDLSDVKEMEFPEAHYEQYRLHPGDILLNEGQTPELVGRPAMYRDELPGVCFTNSLIRFRAGPDVDGDFALLVFRRHLHAGRFKREAQITTNIAHMAAGRFKKVEFPFPPLEQQRQIVVSIQRQLSLLDSLERVVARSVRSSGALRRSILTDAFAGRLVHQDPDDEPASALFERIATATGISPRLPARRRAARSRA